MFIYLIVNHVTGKYYVGQHKGTNLKKYLQQKLSQAWYELKRKGHGGGSYLFASMRKHLPSVWSIHALLSDVKTLEELNQYERDFISFLRSQDPEYGYNIANGGQGGGMLGHKQSPETIEKIRQANMGRQLYPRTPENEVIRIAAWKKWVDDQIASGEYHTPETITKLQSIRALQDEPHRLEAFHKFELEHGTKRRARAAATHKGMKHKMTSEGHLAISEAFKKSSAKRWAPHSLVGQMFERLTVESEAGRNKQGLIQWNCRCVCGGTTIATTTLLRTGHKKSCGCLAKELALANLRVLNVK